MRDFYSDLKLFLLFLKIKLDKEITIVDNATTMKNRTTTQNKGEKVMKIEIMTLHDGEIVYGPYDHPHPVPKAEVVMRWVFGNWYDKWYLAGPENRDYNTAITQERMIEIGEIAAKAECLAPIVFRGRLQ